MRALVRVTPKQPALVVQPIGPQGDAPERPLELDFDMNQSLFWDNPTVAGNTTYDLESEDLESVGSEEERYMEKESGGK